METMADTGFDENFLFANFDSETGTEPEEDQLVVTKPKKSKKTKKTVGEDADQDSSSNNTQNKYINELENQNTKLKSIIKRMMGPQTFKLLQQNADGTDEIDLVQKLEEDIQSKPFAIVLFLNNDVSTVHREEIDNAMKDISLKEAKRNVLMAQKLQPQNSAVPLKAFSANSKGRRFNPGSGKDSEEPYIVCARQYYKGFSIDRLGAPLLESNPNVADIGEVPVYAQVFFKALPILEEALNVRVKHMKQCFNCGGEHHLNECPEPKDQKRIRENRQQFTSKFGSPNLKLQEEVEERFKHFRAGEISIELEEALGISLKDQLPPYIYKMRELGYPPGWVKPAEDDGLKIYGVNGNVIESIDYEEGEIKNVALPDIINFVGYNADLPAGVPDEFREMSMPPFNKNLAEQDISQKRAKYLGYFENEPPAKRLMFDQSASSTADNMEIDNEEPEMVGGKPPLPLIDITARPPSPEGGTEGDDEKTPDDDNANDDDREEALGDGKDDKSAEDKSSNEPETSADKTAKIDGSQSRVNVAKDIDDTTYRHWYSQPLTSFGLTYVMYTPPPLCKVDVDLEDLPRNPVTDIDREPWKTSSVSWYFPLYGDLAAPTGTFDAIRTILKETKRPKRKPMT